MDTLLLIGRIIFGGIIFYSGLTHFMYIHQTTAQAKSKGVFLPELMVVLTGVMLMAGGLGILLWQYVPYALALLALFFLVVSFVMHAFWNYKGSERVTQMYYFLGNMQILGLIFIVFALVY